MSRPLRIVLDNNVVIVRMLLAAGTVAAVFDLAFASCVLLISPSVFEELRAVAERPKFDRYLTIQERREFIKWYAGRTQTVTAIGAVNECRDAKDNHLLDLALAGRADMLVTGDADLLTLHPWRGIDILSPAQFLAHVR